MCTAMSNPELTSGTLDEQDISDIESLAETPLPERWEPQADPTPEAATPVQPPLSTKVGALVLARNLKTKEMPVFQGYEAIRSFNTLSDIPPPSSASKTLPEEPRPEDFGSLPELGVEECRRALIRFAAEKAHCGGTAAAEKHDIKAIRPTLALHYILDTFLEYRSVTWKFIPFRGQPIDGPHKGTPPQPWDIPCSPDEFFKNHTKKTEVPHTNVVKPCHQCDAKGFVTCHRCYGSGVSRCIRCEGRGKYKEYRGAKNMYLHVTCKACKGTGLKKCNTCAGDRRITCQACSGYKRLKCFIQMEVKFELYEDYHILEATDMPDELVRDVNGSIIFEQQLPVVLPIASYPVQEIAENSVRLIELHKKHYHSGRPVQQRHVLRGIPVTEVDAEWNSWKSRYWVYGNEGVVYCADYPRSCCVIL